jgi:hypothetical protein
MGAVFNPPPLSVDFEPLRGRELVGREVGDQADGFIFASDMLAGYQSDLGGKGEPDVFSGDGATLQGAAFRNSLVFFESACPRGCRLQRGKNPSVERELV